MSDGKHIEAAGSEESLSRGDLQRLFLEVGQQVHDLRLKVEAYKEIIEVSPPDAPRAALLSVTVGKIEELDLPNLEVKLSEIKRELEAAG